MSADRQLRGWAPLASVRVLDLSRYPVGAIATRRLADLGADVVKVESPKGGDPLRRLPPIARGAALWHELENAGKRSVTADRSQPADQDLIRRLALAADVLLASGTGDPLGAFGLQQEELRTENPDLVICLISSFGVSGPLAEQPAHGMNVDSLAGLAGTTTGADGRDAFVPGVYGGWSNEVAAHNAALGITAGVLGARAGQGGTVIEVSCYDAAVEANRMEIVFGLTAGSGLQETIGPEIWSARHRLYRTADDRLIYFSAIEAGSWRRFCEAVDHPDLATEPSAAAEVDYGSDELGLTLTEVFRSRTAEQWAELFTTHRIPANSLLEATEVAESVPFRTRGLAAAPSAAGVRRIANPIRRVSAPVTAPAEPPELGAHRDEVVAEWSVRSAPHAAVAAP